MYTIASLVTSVPIMLPFVQAQDIPTHSRKVAFVYSECASWYLDSLWIV